MIPHFENISRKNLNFLKPMSLFLKLINLLLGGSESTLVLAIFIRNKVGGVFEFVWQVVLIDPVARVVMGIFIVLRISQFLASSIMTIAEVAKKRPVNLRFYLTPGNKSKDNIVRAAAQLVLDSLQKAS